MVSIEDQNLGIPKSNLPIASYTSVQPVQVSVMAWLTLKGRHREKKKRIQRLVNMLQGTENTDTKLFCQNHGSLKCRLEGGKVL